MGAGISLGQRIREVRLQKKLTQSDVVGDYMTRNMLSKIENGSAAPSVRTLEYLASSLDVPVAYFLDGGDREPLDTEQLREIDDLARLIIMGEKWVEPIALCIRGRAALASGRPESALSLFDKYDPSKHTEDVNHQVYFVIEDCYRTMGNYRMAYEYAIKRIDPIPL